MQLSPEGGIQWAFSTQSNKASPYRVTISKVPSQYEDTLSMLMTNRGSPRALNKRNGSIKLKTMRHLGGS